MTNLTDYDILVSVQSELDKLRKDYNDLTLANLRLKELLKRIRKHISAQETPFSLIKRIDKELEND